MKKTVKQICASVLTVVMLLSVVLITDINITASAETLGGACGENLNWTLNTKNGELIIYGTGEMMYVNETFDEYPWFNYRLSIERVIVKDGVKNIGRGAFFAYENLISVTLPDSVIKIGDSVFWNCSKLSSITIPDSVTSIGVGVLFLLILQV